MNFSLAMYGALALFWLALAGMILLGYHERIIGQAEPWKQYLVAGICLLMVLLNMHRLLKLRLRQARTRNPRATSFQDDSFR